MKNFVFSFHFLFLFFILKLIEFTSNESVDKYYLGEDISQDNAGNENAIENNCLCDMNIGMCDYLCCCDTDCDDNEIDTWRNQTKCIDQKDIVGIFADRCIDRHLVSFYNKRRGLKREYQTEDIKKIENKNILNYCFSMDNSGKMTKNITSLQSYFTENGIEYNEETIKVIGDFIYNNTFKIENSNNIIQDNNQNDVNTQMFIKFKNISEKSIFHKSGYFSLFSGLSCQNSKNVEIFKAENYSCIMVDNNLRSKIKKKTLENIIFESSSGNCTIQSSYIIRNRLLNVSDKYNDCANHHIVEVEFLLLIENSEVQNCLINVVCTDENFTIFKNSVIFTQTNNNIPYRYSGNGGYLNNFPLKIYSKNKAKVYNEFYIVGRDQDGNCRTNKNTDDINDIYNYLYNYDKPIYFKQDYSYSCILKGNYVKDTVLYKKINDIDKIAKYGSSSYKNIDNSDWIVVKNSNINENDKYIIMNIYIKKHTNLGFYYPKYIYDVILESNNLYNDKHDLKFDIKFIDLDDENNESKYNSKPDKPLFIPNIPDDILDPLFYSDVDK